MAASPEKKNPKSEVIKIDGQEYNLANLSAEAKKLLLNIRVVQTEISKHQARIEIARTAQTVYLDLFKKAAKNTVNK